MQFPSGKQTVRPWKIHHFDGMKPRKDGDFHGRTVSLPEGSSYLVHSLKLALSLLLLMFTF